MREFYTEYGTMFLALIGGIVTISFVFELLPLLRPIALIVLDNMM